MRNTESFLAVSNLEILGFIDTRNLFRSVKFVRSAIALLYVLHLMK